MDYPNMMEHIIEGLITAAVIAAGKILIGFIPRRKPRRAK